MTRRNLLLLSNSTLHPSGYLEYAQKYITDFLNNTGVKSVLFIPYALRDTDGYAEKARVPFEKWGFRFSSIHHAQDPLTALDKADSVFVGGGNTFQLLKSLYDLNLVHKIRKRVLEDGMPYIGSSAGTNVSTWSINTTNDMPIVYPPSFLALGLVPFNINPHFIETDPNSTHKGETREERILQYQELPESRPVIALKEGSLLHVEGDNVILEGQFPALLFRGKESPKSFNAGTNFRFLLEELIQ